jgi:hypothetical protein
MFESSIEEDFFTLLRFNRLVSGFEHQPIKVEWIDADGAVHEYTPDVLVHYRTDLPEAAGMIPTLCEVKPDIADDQKPSRHRGPRRKEDEAESALKWAAAERLATNRGWAFKVYRETEIRTPYLTNARFLLRHLERGAPNPELDGRLLASLQARGPMSLSEWTADFGTSALDRARILPVCYRLLALGLVVADLTVPLSLESHVTAAPNG